jgi:anti-anti-sigma factor
VITVSREAAIEQMTEGGDSMEKKVKLSDDQLLQVTREGEVAVVKFGQSKILDQSHVQQIGEELEALIHDHGFTMVIINFENVSYMSSAVMGKLVATYKMLDAKGGRMLLCNISDSIYEIFEIMRFDQLFDIVDSEDEAIRDIMG